MECTYSAAQYSGSISLARFKKRRGEAKDPIDVKIIDNFMAREASGQSLIAGISLFFSPGYIYNRYYNKSRRRTVFFIPGVLTRSPLLTKFTLLMLGRDTS